MYLNYHESEKHHSCVSRLTLTWDVFKLVKDVLVKKLTKSLTLTWDVFK